MPYPIILGGDHAEFEREWTESGRPEHERPDWPLPSFDARDWAAAFCKIAKENGHDLDEGWVTTWFANALMRGYDQRAALGLQQGRSRSLTAEAQAAIDEVRQQMRGVCPDIDADERSFQDFRVCQAILAALENLDARLKALEDHK